MNKIVSYDIKELNFDIEFAVGKTIEVIPTDSKEYGIFCYCGNGYNGLIHISKISQKFVNNIFD